MTLKEFSELYVKFNKIIKDNPEVIKEFFDEYFKDFVPFEEMVVGVQEVYKRDSMKDYFESLKKDTHNFILSDWGL